MNDSNSSEDTRFSSQWVNLSLEQLGARVLFASDDFFAEKENLLKPGRGVFIPDKYTERGKWMDGWESRRKRVAGHDHCIVRLGLAGVLKGLDIDTNHFLGNHPPFASVEACYSEKDATDSSDWVEILPKSFLGPGMQNLFQIHDQRPFNHLRLHIYPDGGVARLKAYGEVHVDPDHFSKGGEFDLAAMVNGGRVLACNDMFFSSRDNLIIPGRGINMGDGWETRRRRIPGNDWLILKLGKEGVVQRAVVDTLHFKRNFPDGCSLEAARVNPDEEEGLILENLDWTPLLSRVPLQADREHEFSGELLDIGPVTHIRLSIYPDGGIGRLRLFGMPS